MWDRFYDHYVQEPMQKIVTDRLRPAGQSDAHGVEQAKQQLLQAYKVAEPMMQSKTWAMVTILPWQIALRRRRCFTPIPLCLLDLRKRICRPIWTG